MAGLRIVDLDGTDRWGNEIRNSWGDDWGSKNRHGVGGFGVLEVGGRWQRGKSGRARFGSCHSISHAECMNHARKQ